jgi:hypothetical protein
MASPSPRPRVGSDPDGVPCRNGSNTWGRNPGIDADAGVGNDELHSRLCFVHADVNTARRPG